ARPPPLRRPDTPGRVAQADAAIKARETEIARSRVTAPIDGEILKLNVRAGESAAVGITPEPRDVEGGLIAFGFVFVGGSLRLLFSARSLAQLPPLQPPG